MKNEANLKSSNLTATLCSTVVYSTLHLKIQNGTKPNEANFKKENPRFSSETQTKNFFMESKANFGNSEINTSDYTKKVYADLHPQNHPKSKPNPNPISWRQPI